MINKLKALYAYMTENHPETANDIYFGLEMVQSTVETSISTINNDLHIAVDNEDNLDKYTNMRKDAKELFVAITRFMEELVSIENSFSEDDTGDEERTSVTNEKVCDLTEDFTSKRVCSIIIKGKKYYVKNFKEAQIKLCDVLYSIDSKRFLSMMNEPFVKSHINPFLSNTKTASKYEKINAADIYLWTNTPSRDKSDFVKNALKYFGISYAEVQLGIDTSYKRKERGGTKKREETDPTVSDMKIGAYVQSKMKELERSGYIFSQEMLSALLSKEMTKKLIGVNYPMLLKYDESKDISMQGVSSSGQRRYWIKLFVFNGEKYLITSQWFEYNREGFDIWYSGLR